MTNNKSLLFYIFIFVLLVGKQDLQATTNCDQAFTFLARSKGNNPVFWIAEDVGEECFVSYLLLVTISPSKATLISIDLRNFGDWDWLKEGTEHLRTELPVELENQNGTWKITQTSEYIKPPPYNSKLSAQFDKHIRKGGSNGVSWNRNHGLKGILLPVIGGAKTKLIYFYPVGLYINYDIAKVYYFPKSGYILIFTHQPKLAVGLDTMHGFLLLKMVK